MSDTPKTEIEAKRFDYSYHLQLDQLLSVMHPVTPHPEEHLFLTMHHTLQLWFKHMIHDLAQANRLMKRAAEILKLAEAHWTVMETMLAAGFSGFRSHRTGASGGEVMAKGD